MKTEPKLRPVGFTPPSRCSSLSPPVALHFPPPSPSLPPAIALLILPSPSLPWLTLFPMLLLFSLSQSVCLPCSFSSPSPPQGPTHSSSSFAGALAPSVSVGQQHHQHLCLAAPRLPPPALRQPRLDCPLPPPVHLSLTALLLPPASSLSPPPHPVPPPHLLPPLNPPLPPPPSLISVSLVSQSLLPPPSSPPTSSPLSLTWTPPTSAAPHFLLRTSPPSTALQSSSRPHTPPCR
ncbi:unnamed protein product [Closterium sp. NIES-64]|nr:unnamed protein product [Closterium sp. NIES-64]